MKNFVFYVFGFLILMSCKNSSDEETVAMEEESVFEQSFKDHKEVAFLADYEKVSDTSMTGGGFEDLYKLTELKKGKTTLVLFKKINKDPGGNESYKIVDTLGVSNIGENQFLTIGYCTLEKKSDEEIIALIERSDSLFSPRIYKAWRANISTEKFELINDLQKIRCLNEMYKEE